MLAGHALVQENRIADGRVSSGTADEPLEADVPKARVDLGSGAPRAREEPVSSLPDLRQGLKRGFWDSLARIAQRPVDVDKDSMGR